MKNPPILILDEATSALDSVTEADIQHSFEELAEGRTTLVIAHRLSTVKHADEIVVIDEHGIRERGTHEALLAKKRRVCHAVSGDVGRLTAAGKAKKTRRLRTGARPGARSMRFAENVQKIYQKIRIFPLLFS